MEASQWWRKQLLFAVSLGLLMPAWTSCGRQAVSEETGEETEAGTPNPRSDSVELRPEVQKQLRLQYSRVERRNLNREIRLNGVVQPNPHNMTVVRPLGRGRLQSVRVTVGDRVTRGQVLAFYDDIELGDLIARRATAQTALKRATSEAAVTREALERASHLVESGAIALAEKQRREADYEQARSGIEEAQTELDQIDQKIRRLGGVPGELARQSGGSGVPGRSSFLTPVEAPFAGIVTETKVAEGEVIDPDTALFQIADISTVWVQGNLHEKDIGLIHPGQRATVRVASYSQRIFDGRITYISDFLDTVSRTAQVRCEVPNSNLALKVGMFATVAVALPESTAVLAVPASAIQQIDSQPVVFVRQSPNVFQKRSLQPGRKADGWIEVLGGVSEGEEVVTDRSFQLKAIVLHGSLGEEE